METKTFRQSYSSFGINWFINPKTNEIEVILALSKDGDLPYGFPGGKQNAEDLCNPATTRDRECDEEGSPRLINPVEFYVHKRRNDDGSGTGYPNYFSHSQEGKRKRKTKPVLKDTIIETRWLTLLEAETLPMKMSHRGALIEFCFHLEEILKDNEVAMAYLRKLSYKLFERPSALFGNNRVKEISCVTPLLKRSGNKIFPWHDFIKEYQNLPIAA
jgi:hypothetical protein